MLFGALSLLALSAITIATPAPLDVASSSGARRAVARGDSDDKCLQGYIKLTTYDGKDYGYVGTRLAYYGAYLRATGNEEKLLVKIDDDITTLIGSPANPYFAGIVGEFSNFSGTDNLGKGSYNYFYLGAAVSTTPPGASAQPISNTFTVLNTPVRDAETAIFHDFDKTTKCFDVQWVNRDFSRPETFVGVYEFDGSGALFGTGDRDALVAQFGTATFVKLSFEKVEKQ